MHEIHTRPSDYDAWPMGDTPDLGHWDGEKYVAAPSARDDAARSCPWDVTAGGVRSGS